MISANRSRVAVATRFEQILRLVDEHGKTFVDAETQELL